MRIAMRASEGGQGDVEARLCASANCTLFQYLHISVYPAFY